MVRTCPIYALLSMTRRAFVLSGAGREFAMGFSLARSVDIVTVEKIDQQLCDYDLELLDADPDEHNVIIRRIDDCLEQRRTLTHG